MDKTIPESVARRLWKMCGGVAVAILARRRLEHLPVQIKSVCVVIRAGRDGATVLDGAIECMDPLPAAADGLGPRNDCPGYGRCRFLGLILSYQLEFFDVAELSETVNLES